MIVATQITDTEIFAFITVLVIKLKSCKVLFINTKDKRNRYKIGYLSRKLQILQINYSKIINRMRNFLDNFETCKRSFINDFSVCMTVPLSIA